MIREIELNGNKIRYELIIKSVKNINLRINSEGKISVSASKTVPIEYIENILLQNATRILNTLSKVHLNRQSFSVEKMNEDELIKFIISFSKEVYPYYKQKTGINFPIIKFRKMKSRWGSCCPTKESITFSTNLIYASKECIKYVVHHEFTHFIHPNHSSLFYKELSKSCPDWKELKKSLSAINIPR